MACAGAQGGCADEENGCAGCAGGGELFGRDPGLGVGLSDDDARLR